jgi:carbon monoxide dehydrogenase subunit G
MKISGERTIPAPRDRVWAALIDPDILRQSIPGCESFEKTGDNAYRATVVSRIGPIQAKFQGNVRLSDLDPPNGYRISGEGAGGAAGAAKGGAVVRLEPLAADSTRLTYDVDAQVSGKLAQLGSRLIESTAAMMAGQFFQRFEQVVAGEAPADAPAGLPFWVYVVVLLVLGALVFALISAF